MSDARERSLNNHFVALPLDRLAEQREQFDPATCTLPMRWLLLRDDGRVLLQQARQSAALSLLDSPYQPDLPWSLLGEYEGAVYLLQWLDEAPNEPAAPTPPGRWVDLRSCAEQLPRLDAGLAAYARALVLWRQSHRHCGRCGATMQTRSAGHRLLCSRQTCGNEVFPRIDPAIIVAISHGERLLLARQASWPAHRHSVLAGFVEPGESLEDCVRREVMEEAGLRLGRVDYHSSQPWPFPSALMLGFTATALDDRLRLGDELERAGWYDPDTLVAAIRGGALLLPTGFSVSRRLVEDWFEMQTGTALASRIDTGAG